jgi:hypothetical protein
MEAVDIDTDQYSIGHNLNCLVLSGTGTESNSNVRSTSGKCSEKEDFNAKKFNVTVTRAKDSENSGAFGLWTPLKLPKMKTGNSNEKKIKNFFFNRKASSDSSLEQKTVKKSQGAKGRDRSVSSSDSGECLTKVRNIKKIVATDALASKEPYDNCRLFSKSVVFKKNRKD